MSPPRQLRAPKHHGAVLSDPPLAETESLINANRSLIYPKSRLLGRFWEELRRQAHRETVSAARQYLAEAGEPVPEMGDRSIFLAGHQPELFHPGVWVKNFALQGLARAHEATAINLVVDNDTAKSTALRLPAPGPGGDWHVVSVPFDHWTGDVPYEERAVRDERVFAALADEAARIYSGWGFRPLLPEYWAEVGRQSPRTPLLGERLVSARRALERRWGCHNLELPVSRLCRTEAFARFACHLLVHHERLHGIYNACVHDYRQRYGIRSRNHPVPDLARDGVWWELPFWAWDTGQQRRSRLYARTKADRIELRAGQNVWPSLPVATDADGDHLVRMWQNLESIGHKVRSRALTNTLFTRLFVGDLFIHGIGGGKYDELTDEIARRFYGFDPPGYVVLTATLLLPLPGFPVGANDCRQLRLTLRDLKYNPQRHLPVSAMREPAVLEAIRKKEDWIAQEPQDRRGKRERFQRLRAVNVELESWVQAEEAALRERLETCERQVAANAVMQRRDYAFVLYPESVLRPFLEMFLTQEGLPVRGQSS